MTDTTPPLRQLVIAWRRACGRSVSERAACFTRSYAWMISVPWWASMPTASMHASGIDWLWRRPPVAKRSAAHGGDAPDDRGWNPYARSVHIDAMTGLAR
jgi:hypothetical protein